ncbi:MAG: sigma-70 family RNA polymerase sigma factor [Bacillota bacterium]
MPTLDDPEEAQIVAWFQIGLHREATRLAKKQKRLRDHELLILNELVSKEADEEGTKILATIPAPTDVCAEVEDTLFLQQALSLLTPQQQVVITMTILEGIPEQKVADEMGVTRQAVNRIKLRALKRLKKMFRSD